MLYAWSAPTWAEPVSAEGRRGGPTGAPRFPFGACMANSAGMTAQIDPFQPSPSPRSPTGSRKRGAIVIHMEFGQPSHRRARRRDRRGAPGARRRSDGLLGKPAAEGADRPALCRTVRGGGHSGASDPDLRRLARAGAGAVDAASPRATGSPSPGPAMSPIATRCRRCTWSRSNCACGEAERYQLTAAALAALDPRAARA